MAGGASGGKPSTPVDPGYVTRNYAANQGEFQVRDADQKTALPSLTGDLAEGSYLGIPRHYRISTGSRHRACRYADRDHRLQGR